MSIQTPFWMKRMKMIMLRSIIFMKLILQDVCDDVIDDDEDDIETE